MNLSAIYPTARGDDPADHRDRNRWSDRVYSAAGFSPASGRFSNIFRRCLTAGSKRRDHGVFGGTPLERQLGHIAGSRK